MQFYDDVEIHRRMVADSARTGTFRSSIAATVRPGDVVVDVGAGSGILSLFAAQAGAARVYAIERAPGAAALARRLVADNGAQDRVVVIDAHAETVLLPEPADVVVSEWCGVLGVDENMLAPVLAVRDRWLKPGGAIIPGRVTAWLAPVAHAAGAEATAFRTGDYGLDLSAMAPFGPDEVVSLAEGADAKSLRAEPQTLWAVDAGTVPSVHARGPFAAQLTFELRGPVNGLLAWFSAGMPGAAELTNRPGAPRTHWGQLLFPVAHASRAEPGARLQVALTCHLSPGGATQYVWSSRVDDGVPEVHDTRRVMRSPAAPSWRVYTSTGGRG